MARIRMRCSKCGSEVEAVVGQSFANGRLTWHAAYQCNCCGNAIESDSGGPVPEAIRNALLRQEGTWALQVSETQGRAIRALKVLRNALGLSLNEVMQLKKLVPGKPLTGTKAEMERLRTLLINEGLSAWAERLPEAQ